MNNEIVVIIGFSGVGKDTITKELCDNYGYNMVISSTTRPMRPGESPGNPYNFISKEEMDKIKKIECRSYTTFEKGLPTVWYYAVPESAIENDKKYAVVLDWGGYKDFKEIFGSRVVPVFLTLSEKERRARAMRRGGFDLQEWNRRYEDDKNIFLTHEKEIEKECILIESIAVESTMKTLLKELNFKG
jgi:guanylate kinase